MPPVDPSLIRQPPPPGSIQPSGTIRTGTRTSDPYAAEKLGLDKTRVGYTGEGVVINKQQEGREQQKQPLIIRELEAKVKKAEADAIKAEQTAKFREPVDEFINVIDKAATAHKITRQGGTAGNPWGRVLGQYVPGTSARAVASKNIVLSANTAFKALQQMRQESPTGGAVGNVSDTDMKLLQSTIENLDVGLDNKNYQGALQGFIRAYQKVLYKIPGGREAYKSWRLKWLGYDPSKRPGSAEYKGSKVSADVDDILKQYGVK